MKSQKGITLIELIVFIVVIGVVCAGLFISFNFVLEASPHVSRASRAIEVAHHRMDIILATKKIQGFANINDPCAAATPPPLPAVCTSTITGYEAKSTIDNNWNGNTNYKVVTVKVYDPDQATGTQRAILKSVVANY